MKDKVIIITTINPLTKAVADFQRYCQDFDILLIGDKKSTPIESNDHVKFLSIEAQEKLDFCILEYLPYNHYCRKNIGYLVALKEKTSVIYDTDDDNIPYEDWAFPMLKGTFETIGNDKFSNIYKYFTDKFIWPRGFPLENIRSEKSKVVETKLSRIGAWQGLADFDPDVDAIYRLLYTNSNISFKKRSPLTLERGTYCPFNSQNTLWNKEAIPYAYLPVTVTFRFTDILRGIIAQRCFWEHDLKLGFVQATVYQDRNEHNLLADFESEIPCYLEINKIVNLLDNLSLRNDFEYNLQTIYQTLFKEGLVKKEELTVVKAWIKDINRIMK